MEKLKSSLVAEKSRKNFWDVRSATLYLYKIFILRKGFETPTLFLKTFLGLEVQGLQLSDRFSTFKVLNMYILDRKCSK